MLVELEHFNKGTFELVMSKAKATIEVRGIFLNSPTFVSLYKPQFFTYLLEILILKKVPSRKMHIHKNLVYSCTLIESHFGKQ